MEHTKDTYGLTDTAAASRRRILKTGAALAGVAALGVPALVSAQAEKIKIGHLTPLTGFLGALGEYSVMGIKMADRRDQRRRRRDGSPARRDERRIRSTRRWRRPRLSA